MAQRDAGGIPTGSTYVNPVNDPVPAGFTGQGTPTVPAETGPPAGFAGNVRLASVPGALDTNRAMPQPPPGYKPGPLSPVRQDYENSTLFKIGSVLASYGESVPINLKIKLAQQKADMELDQHKMAWDNYYKSVELARSTMEHQNAQAASQFVGMMPNISAQLASVMSKDTKPEDRDGLIKTWKGIAESLYPGGSNFVDFMSKNLHNVFATNVFLNDPKWGPQFQDLASRVGIDQMYQNPEFMKLTDHAAFDWTNTLSASDTVATNSRLGSKNHGVTEDEFRKIVTRGAANQRVQPQMLQTVLSFLDSVKGQEYMASRGIETGSAALAQDKKRKENGLASQLKEEDLVNTKAILDFDKEHPGLLNQQVVDEAKLNFKRHIGTAAKESSPGQFSENNSLSPFLLSVSNGKFKDPDTMLEGVPPGSAEYTKRLGYLNEALNKRAAANPLGGNTAKLDMLHDSNKEPVYTMDKGRIVRKSGPISEGQYRSMQNGFTMSPAQKEHNSKIDAAEIGGMQLLKQAETVYKGKSNAERAGEVAAESILTSGPGFFSDQVRALTAKQYPELAAYVARRDAVLGTYAKGLGGEVGVLTDQDIARVKKLFSGAYDTVATRAAKMKAFKQIIDLNRKAMNNMLTANQGTDDEGQVTASQWQDAQENSKSTVNGILGSVEDLVRKAEPKETQVRSLAEPTAEAGTPSRGESLLEKMRKGK